MTLLFGFTLMLASGCVSHGVRNPATSSPQASVPEGYLAPGRGVTLENPIEFRNVFDRDRSVEISARTERLICRAEMSVKAQSAVMFDAGTQLTVMNLINVIRSPGVINVPEAAYLFVKSDASSDPVFTLSCSLSSQQNPDAHQVWVTQNFDPQSFGYLQQNEVMEIFNFLAANSNLTQGDSTIQSEFIPGQ